MGVVAPSCGLTLAMLPGNEGSYHTGIHVLTPPSQPSVELVADPETRTVTVKQVPVPQQGLEVGSGRNPNPAGPWEQPAGREAGVASKGVLKCCLLQCSIHHI